MSSSLLFLFTYSLLSFSLPSILLMLLRPPFIPSALPLSLQLYPENLFSLSASIYASFHVALLSPLLSIPPFSFSQSNFSLSLCLSSTLLTHMECTVNNTQTHTHTRTCPPCTGASYSLCSLAFMTGLLLLVSLLTHIDSHTHRRGCQSGQSV